MKKRNAILVCSLIAAACCVTAAGCSGCSGDEIKVEITDKTYNPTLGLTVPTHAVDTGMVIDGVLNESVYTAENHRWYNGVKIDGEERATVDVTTVFGDAGIYVAYDVTELTNSIYYNPDRSSWVNSGVEMYFALGGTTSID
ncbi:MAG: hypothetical protein NC311_18725, partial [Muribaculaceae bacterium]|nr:hypothetical protein [Muribaculaceae bacterium]